MQQENCFACGKPITTKPYQVYTADPQMQYVGKRCFDKVKAAGKDGYQPSLGGPRLYLSAPVKAVEHRLQRTGR